MASMMMVWLVALASVVLGDARPPDDPCVKLMRGIVAMQDSCITSEVASLGDRGKDQKAISMLVGLGAFAIPALLDAMHHENARVRGNAAAALGRIGKASYPTVRPLTTPARKDVVKELGAALKDEQPSVRQQAAAALAGMGTYARDVLPALEDARQDPDPLVREWAKAAIRNSQTGQRP